MDLAFCLFDYFPHGGLQRDFLRIALKCQAAGAKIRVYTMSWAGAVPEGFEVCIVPVRAVSNHRRVYKYFQWMEKEQKKIPDFGMIGFNKIPGLDIYFAADSCFAARLSSKGFFARLTPRCRTYLKMERAVFKPDSATRILLIAPRQVEEFRQYYGLAESRFTLLPPGLDENFQCLEPAKARERIRAEFGLGGQDFLLLQVGSAFKTKGVDRAIRALASLPDSQCERAVYLVAGQGRADACKKLAGRLGVGRRVRFAGVRQDVADLMAAADLLLHPARTEAAGMTLTESLASGLPVLCSGICGYAPYVAGASAGIVLPEPFVQQDLNSALQKMLNRDRLARHRQGIKEYCGRVPLSGLTDQAAAGILKRFS